MTKRSPVSNAANPRGSALSGWLLWGGLAAVVAILAVVVLFARKDSSGPALSKETAPVRVGVGAQGVTVGTIAPSGTGTTATTTPVPDRLPGQLAELPEHGADPAVGRTIPTVSGTSTTGKSLTIGPDGQAKVVVFMAHWCPHCQREIPMLAKELADNPMPKDVALYGVSTGVDPAAPNYPPSAWLRGADWTVPTLADSPQQPAAQAFGLSGYPFFVAVDAQGKVVARASGELTAAQFWTLVDAARTGQSPT